METILYNKLRTIILLEIHQNSSYIYSNKIFSNFFHITGVSKILMNVKQMSLCSDMDECKYVLITTLSAENDPSEVADM